jgi:ABC-2 type transport system ATP-binding protein
MSAVGPIIEVHNLRKTYGTTIAIDDISFYVNEGEIYGLLGPNGAGKTTTVECLQSLRQPDSGTIRVLGLDPHTQAQELRRRIGSQLQESALPDRIRVWEALDLFASVTPDALDWRVLLEQWGLAEKRKASFSSLSGGQRQRLFIALALVNNPSVVFLDEMTTGLDPAARHVAWDLIHAIRGRGTTVVLVTHFMDEAERLCDRVAIVDRGSIIASDTPQGLITEHASSPILRGWMKSRKYGW